MQNSLFDYYFETIGVEGELRDQRAFVVGAIPFRMANDFQEVFSYQPQKYHADLWQKIVSNDQRAFPAPKSCNIACISISKSKEESLEFLKLALYVLKEDGLIVAIGANDANGKRLVKWMNELGVNVESLSKDKHRVVYGKKPNEAMSNYSPEYELKLIELDDDQFVTISGIYGWNKIDVGSDLLTEFLPDDLTGQGADFGCGYGFLSKAVLKNCRKIQFFDLIDADARALVAAQENMDGYGGDATIDYKWIDITDRTQLTKQYDFIVMNPPFHEGKKADSNIGINFIINASACLRNNGVLYMVANRHLPYEDALSKNFKKAEKIAEEDGYKVFKAIK